ncbi:32381_t:CDS:2, partial [Gigaspora margarita]
PSYSEEHFGGVSYTGWSESTGANLWKSPTVDLHNSEATTNNHTENRDAIVIFLECLKRGQLVEIANCRPSYSEEHLEVPSYSEEHFGGVSYTGWSESTGANLWKSPTVDLHNSEATTNSERMEHFGGVSYAGWSESTGANLWKSPTVDLHNSETTTNSERM